MTASVALLYVMGFPGGPFKVGWSQDVPARVLAIAREEGRADVVVYRTVPVEGSDVIAAERYAHWLLRDYHFRNEWFDAPLEKALAAITESARCDFRVIGRIPPLQPRGRPAMYPESVVSWFPNGTSRRMVAALGEGEERGDLIRSATMAELERREGMAKTKAPAKRTRSTVK